MKKYIALLIAAFPLLLQAQISQFGAPSYLTTNLTSGVLATTTFSVLVPAISLQITATNNSTVVTNYINNSFYVNGTNLIPQTIFVYTAATMGTNFTTNFPPYYLTVTNYVFGNAQLQSGGSNTVYIK